MGTKTPKAAALAARDRLALRYLREADALADAMARRLRGLADPDDLRQEARLALLRAAGRVRPGADPLPYIRRTVAGSMRRYVRDRLRLVRVPAYAQAGGAHPLAHASLDAMPQELAAPMPETADGTALGAELLRMVETLPAAEAAALRLTVLEGRSLRDAAAELEVSRATVARHRRRAVEAIRWQIGA